MTTATARRGEREAAQRVPQLARRGSPWAAVRWLALHAIVASLALLFCTPLLFAISASLKTNAQAVSPDVQWIPHPFKWSNFAEAFAARHYAFPLYVLNTLVITQLAMVGTVLSSSLVAYGFARFEFPGKKILFGLLISTMLLPGQVTMIPVFLIWKHLGLVDTIVPLTLPAFLGGGAFNIFLLRQFYMQLPRSLDEAAMLDGCSSFGIWWRILMPLSKPALITVALFTFAGCWEDFMGPLIYLQDARKYTVSVGLQLYNDEYGGTNLPLLMAASLLHIAPVVVIFIVAQKYFVRGIATSGLKD
jgi:ABC-type glycerol-3-phosphate transport system permease component